MPEGPEIRRAADRVARVLVGHVAEVVDFGLPQLAPFGADLSGVAVTQVTTRGKAMLTTFANDYVVYSHNQLYGRWYVQRRGRRPKTQRQLRLSIETATHAALLYSASDIDVLPADQLEAHPFLARVGPDALDPELEESAVLARIQSDRFRRRSLGHLLLDQAFIAGLGNYLRAEIAFAARVDPRRRAGDLDDAEAASLSREILRITRRSYRLGGITVPRALAQALKRDGWPRRHHRHAVFGRAGHACWTCGTTVEGFVLAGRRCFACPDCQA